MQEIAPFFVALSKQRVNNSFNLLNNFKMPKIDWNAVLYGAIGALIILALEKTVLKKPLANLEEAFENLEV